MSANVSPKRKPRRVLRLIRRHPDWTLSIAATLLAGLVLLAADPGLLYLLLLPLGAFLGLAIDRLRERWGWHRKGGKAALRKRRRYQGHASMSELARNLPHDRGVPIGTVRRQSW